MCFLFFERNIEENSYYNNLLSQNKFSTGLSTWDVPRLGRFRQHKISPIQEHR